jgi:hypothetical protein
MAQHKALHPDYGPPPWSDRLREVDQSLSDDRGDGAGGNSGEDGGG